MSVVLHFAIPQELKTLAIGDEVRYEVMMNPVKERTFAANVMVTTVRAPLPVNALYHSGCNTGMTCVFHTLQLGTNSTVAPCSSLNWSTIMTAAVAPGLQEVRLGTPPSRRCPTPPSMKAFGVPDSGLVFGGRRVATPMGLSALWENWKDPKELVSHSLPAPPGPPGPRTMQGQWLRGSGSPKKSGPLLIRAEAPPAAHTPRTRFDSPSPLRDPRPVSTSRPSVTPSRLGFPDPKSPAPERAASPMVRHASPAPAAPAPAPLPALPRRRDTAVSGQVRHKEDLIHQHVLYVLRKNPDVARLRRVQQVTEGVYLIDGQEVNIEWRHSSEPGQRGWPIVVDGPMRQPLIDYLRDNEENKEFDLDTVVCTTALHQVPKNKRMTFDDKHKQYSRLEAMKVAKEQASIREQAADYTLDGKQVPDELVRRYNQALRTKVRSNRSKEDRVIIAQEKQDLAPLHSAQAGLNPPRLGHWCICDPDLEKHLFTTLYLDVSIPALEAHTRFGLKVAPSEHQQIFDSVDKLVKGLFKELDVVSLGGVLTEAAKGFGFAADLGPDGPVACILSASSSVLTNAVELVPRGTPVQLAKAGLLRPNTPSISGFNKDDGAMFVTGYPISMMSMSQSSLDSYFSERYGEERKSQLQQLFPPPATGSWWISKYFEAAQACETDFSYSCTAMWISTWSSPSFVYKFSQPDSQGLTLHGDEIPYIFGTLESPSSTDLQVSQWMMKYWANFAKTGDPNGPGLPHWPSWQQPPASLLNISDQPVLAEAPNNSWPGCGFFLSNWDFYSLCLPGDGQSRALTQATQNLENQVRLESTGLEQDQLELQAVCQAVESMRGANDVPGISGGFEENLQSSGDDVRASGLGRHHWSSGMSLLDHRTPGASLAFVREGV
eukprot:s1853_g5.t1